MSDPVREVVGDDLPAGEYAASSPEAGMRMGLQAGAAQARALLCHRPALALALAGALSVLAIPPFHLWPILGLTLPVLFWALEQTAERPTVRCRLTSALWRGLAFGFGYHLAGLYWIGSAFLVQPERFALIMPFAIGGLAAFLALFHGGAAILAGATLPATRGLVRRIAVLALALMASEWLRGHILTGFPWNTLGQALTMPLPLMQSVGLFGIYGLTAIAVLTLATPLVAISAHGPRRALPVIVLVTAVPLALLFAYGAIRLAAIPTTYVEGVRLRLVQPSIDQRDKFDNTKRRWIFDRHLELSGAPPTPQSATEGWDATLSPTHVIWPEAAIPFFLRREPGAFAAIRAALPDTAVLFAGTFRLDVDPAIPDEAIKAYRIFNVAAAVGGNGGLITLYDKRHLVPFGEYLPARPLLNALGLENLTRTRGGMHPGEGPRPYLSVPGLPPVEPLICYEAIFPEEVATGRDRPGVLLNLTNDAWFGITTGPYQHFHQARLRAVEQGLPLLRSANNGISAVVDPLGRVTAALALDAVGVIDHGLPRPADRPPYGCWRGLIELAVALALAAWVISGLKVWTRRGGSS